MSNAKFAHILPALVIGLSSTALSTSSQANHSWGGYHWARTTNQFTLKLGDNMTTADWRAQLSAASSDWNSPTLFGATFTPIVTAITAGQSNRNCSMVLGTTQVCNGKYGNNGWLGLASINIIDGTHIVQGSAKMNDSYFNLAKYGNPNEKRHVVCQEVAHTFGLGHQDESGISLNTCMDYFSNTGANATSTQSTQPNAHDFEELNLIYGDHLDSTTTVAVSTAASAARLGASAGDISDDPRSWGHLVSQSASGRSSTYRRSNTDGSETVTHVLWTEEAARDCPACDHRYDH